MWVGIGDQRGTDRHAGEAADQKWPNQLEVDDVRERRQRRRLPDDRTDDDQRHGEGGRQHVEPDSQRNQSGAKAGEAGHEAAAECAKTEKHKGGRGHRRSVFPASFRGALKARTSDVQLNIGESRNDSRASRDAGMAALKLASNVYITRRVDNIAK
jgi:hypothetical protein